jgi:hypothetical protein
LLLALARLPRTIIIITLAEQHFDVWLWREARKFLIFFKKIIHYDPHFRWISYPLASAVPFFFLYESVQKSSNKMQGFNGLLG